MVFHIFLYVCICLYPRVQDVAVILVSHMPEGCPGRASTNSDAWPFVKATVFRHGRNLEVGWGSSMDELLVFCFFFFGWTKKAEVSIPLEHWGCLRLHWHHLRFWCFELIIWAELILTYAVRMSRYMLEIAMCGGMPRQVQIQMCIWQCNRSIEEKAKLGLVDRLIWLICSDTLQEHRPLKLDCVSRMHSVYIYICILYLYYHI